jgi:hypothetical protein
MPGQLQPSEKTTEKNLQQSRVAQDDLEMHA